eukprot:GHVN01054107.1.p1 GENE.GHVN01054107.1~~GHVN01054107.1.p1  ORF type:complete len:455 (-),score=119.67 GHVN01054107.1:34-1398(-)
MLHQVLHLQLIDVALRRSLWVGEMSHSSDDSLVWGGISTKGVPLLALVSGEVLGLFPTWGSTSSGVPVFDREWVPVLNLKQASNSLDVSFWVVYGDAEELQVIRLKEFQLAPDASRHHHLTALPYRLTGLDSLVGERGYGFEYSQWLSVLRDDPTLKEYGQGKTSSSANLHWRLNDECRLRSQLLTNHLAQAANEGLLNLVTDTPIGEGCDPSQIEEQVGRLRATIEKHLYKIFRKTLADARVEASYEATTMFERPKSFQAACSEAEKRGERGLIQRLEQLIHSRTLAEASLQQQVMGLSQMSQGGSMGGDSTCMWGGEGSATGVNGVSGLSGMSGVSGVSGVSGIGGQGRGRLDEMGSPQSANHLAGQGERVRGLGSLAGSSVLNVPAPSPSNAGGPTGSVVQNLLKKRGLASQGASEIGTGRQAEEVPGGLAAKLAATAVKRRRKECEESNP